MLDAQDAINQGYPLSISLIKRMHQELLSSGRGVNKSPGQFKTAQNYLADTITRKVVFVPIAPEKLAEGMERLFKYIEESDDHILMKCAVAHLEFEALHPFQDGNGRIGRMLIPLMLWHYGMISSPNFYLSAYFEQHKKSYLEIMRHVSETGDWHHWLTFFFDAITQQAIQQLRVIQDIQSLYEEMKVRMAELVGSKHQFKVLDFLFTYPIFRGTKLAEKTGISVSTANRVLTRLQENGILKVSKAVMGRKTTLYTFELLMQLVRV